MAEGIRSGSHPRIGGWVEIPLRKLTMFCAQGRKSSFKSADVCIVPHRHARESLGEPCVFTPHEYARQTPRTLRDGMDKSWLLRRAQVTVAREDAREIPRVRRSMCPTSIGYVATAISLGGEGIDRDHK